MNSVFTARETNGTPVSPNAGPPRRQRTASSAELLLLCFRGLDDTRSFGAPTAGYCSVNQCFRLYDGTQTYLTVAADRARTGEVFESEPIEPDETAASPESTALAWLKSR